MRASRPQADGSHLAFEDNLLWTKAAAALAHSFGASAEAELGKLAGEEDGLSVEGSRPRMQR